MAGLTYSEWGPQDGPLLVLLHGFMGTGDDWAAVAEALPEFRILAPDLPGHGRSTGLPDSAYSLAGAAELCAGLLKPAEGREAVLLAGYSMGGRVAQEILATGGLPARARLCLIGAHPGLPSAAERAERLEADRKLAALIEKNFEATLGEWLSLPMFATLTAAMRETLTQRRLSTCDPRELARALRGLSTGNQPDRRTSLDAAAHRIRLVAGEHDERYVRLLSGLLPDLVTVAGAGHNVPVEQPAELATILKDLALRELDAGRGA